MKKLIVAALAALMLPSNAWAALCPFPDAKATKCEIPLCVQAGFPSSAGCRPALREFIKRAFWGKSPVPFPPECMCTWIPEVVIPTNQYGVPFFLEESIPFGAVEGTVQYASADHIRQTPFDAPSAPQPLYMTPHPKLADAKVIENPTQAQITARTSSIIRNQEAYRTNCNTSMFRRGNRGTCFIISGGERIDLQVTRDRYRRIPRRYRYDYIVTSRKLDGTGDIHQTRMRIKHKTLQSCEIFLNGRRVSDTRCNMSDLHSLVATPPTDVPSDPDTIPTRPTIDPTGPTEERTEPEDNGVMVFE